MRRFEIATACSARPVLRLAVVLALASLPRPAACQPALDDPGSSPGAAASEPDLSAELFRQARTLRRAGRTQEACAKFEESLALRRSPGTLLNIGSCREDAGDLSSAVQAFRGALELARTEPDPAKAELWSAAARQHLDLLEPRVAELRLVLQDTARVQVSLDGSPIQVSEQPLVLEPGTHQLRASAAGMQEFAVGIELVAGGKLALTIPRLSPAQSAPSAPVPQTSLPEAAPDAAGATTPAWHWWLLGGAGALLLAGGVVGLVAADAAADLKHSCPDRSCPDGLSPVQDVKHTALVADSLYGAGILTAGVGLALVLTQPQRAAAPAALAGSCSAQGCDVTLSGRF